MNEQNEVFTKIVTNILYWFLNLHILPDPSYFIFLSLIFPMKILNIKIPKITNTPSQCQKTPKTPIKKPSHSCKQCLFFSNLRFMITISSNNSICLVSLLPYKVNIAKIYRLMFLQVPINIIQQYTPQLALAMVAAFQSSQTLWNKSSASIFVFYLIACNAAIWRYEINV